MSYTIKGLLALFFRKGKPHHLGITACTPPDTAWNADIGTPWAAFVQSAPWGATEPEIHWAAKALNVAWRSSGPQYIWATSGPNVKEYVPVPAVLKWAAGPPGTKGWSATIGTEWTTTAPETVDSAET